MNESKYKKQYLLITVKGNVYVANGTLQVATKKYVDEIHGSLISGDYTVTDPLSPEQKKNTAQSGAIYNHLVYRSERADKLSPGAKINGVHFDGTHDIEVPFYKKSDSPPANKSLLWIHATNKTIYYYDQSEEKWMPTTSVWAEDSNKGIS